MERTYQINTGAINGFFGLGWGVGTYGASTYGTARATSNIFLQPRTWSFSLWGEDLIANPRGGAIYVWDTSTGTGTRATAITGSPDTAEFILVTPESRHLIAFGAYDGSINNKLNIRWSDREDYTSWTAASSNRAGSKLLDRGSRIVSAQHTGREILVWTDDSLHSMQYIGGNEVFAFTTLGESGVGIRGPHAKVSLNGVAFWMGASDFFMYDGRIQPLPCTVKSYVFDNMNDNQRDKCWAVLNREFNEIWWFYPDGSNDEISKCVIYNYLDRVWSIGSRMRTAGVDRSEVIAQPVCPCNIALFTPRRPDEATHEIEIR